MDNLTTIEKTTLDNLTRNLNKKVLLGAILQNMINSLGVEGTPVNAEAAATTLTFTGVVKDGETLTIGANVYEIAADEAQTVAAGNIAVDITAVSTASSGTLTMDTQPVSGDTITIGSKTYIFVPVGTDTAPYEVSIGADVAGAQANLVAAINGTDVFNDPHPTVEAGTFAANASIITALIAGTSGDVIVTTETFTAGTNIFAAGTLGSGADCTAANAIVKLVAEITAHDTVGVVAVDGDGDTLVLTADIKGAAGNSIAVATTMAFAAFGEGVDSLEDGVNGTISEGMTFMVDDTNMYVSVGQNGISDDNWKKVKLLSL